MNLYGFSSFDELIAFHCSPVLMNIKAANMISVANENSEDIEVFISAYNRQFADNGIVFKKLCCCSKRSLLLVYNKERLGALLRDKGCRAYLTAAGYNKNNTLDEDLAFLEQRLQQGESFPHEIGIFLEYPLEDVLGFVLNKGDNCKYSGYWKVYGDVTEAQKIFSAYEKCRDYLLNKLTSGVSLHMAVNAG